MRTLMRMLMGVEEHTTDESQGLLICSYGVEWRVELVKMRGIGSGPEEADCMHKYAEMEWKCASYANQQFMRRFLTNMGRDCKGAVITNDGKLKPILHG